MAESFPTDPAVGDFATASWASVAAADAVIADFGIATITPSTAFDTYTLAVAFNKTFPSTPAVLCQFLTPLSTGTNPGTLRVWPSSRTTSGFTLNIQRSTTAATQVLWVALLSQ